MSNSKECPLRLTERLLIDALAVGAPLGPDEYFQKFVWKYGSVGDSALLEISMEIRWVSYASRPGDHQL